MLESLLPPISVRLHDWLMVEAINLAKIAVLTALLIRLLRWTTRALPKWSTRDPDTPHREQQMRTAGAAMNTIGTFIILAIAGMTALREVGLDVRPVLTGAGVIGLIIGLGAQNIVRDSLSGLYIMLENQFVVGDTIRAAGVTGSVELVTLRRTILRDDTGAMHTVPNGEIRVVANLTRTWSQTTLAIAVAPAEPLERVFAILKSTGEELAGDTVFSGLLLEPPRLLGLEKLAGQQMEILMQVRVKPGKNYDIAREWRRRVKLAFEREGISLQSPLEVHYEPRPSGSGQEGLDA